LRMSNTTTAPSVPSNEGVADDASSTFSRNQLMKILGRYAEPSAGTSDLHIGQRIYVQDGGATKNDDVQIVDSVTNSPTSNATVNSHTSDGVGGWARRDYVTTVVFMSVVVIFLILIYVSIRQKLSRTKPSADLSLTIE
jgi:hypothetical protein